jgi:hypothetical protein
MRRRKSRYKQKFPALEYCDKIANYYADVLFSIYSEVKKEWNHDPNYHCVVRTKENTTEYIRFTQTYIKYNEEPELKCIDDNEPEFHDDELELNHDDSGNINFDDAYFKSYANQIGTAEEQKRKEMEAQYGEEYYRHELLKEEKIYTNKIKKGTIIFIAEPTKKLPVANEAMIYIYGDNQSDIQFINRCKDYFTVSGKRYNYSGKIIAIEEFKKQSLVTQALDFGRGLGQRAKSEKKTQAARINSKKGIEKISIQYKAIIECNGKTTEKYFNTETECFKIFSSEDGAYKIFNNLMGLRRTLNKHNGRYEYPLADGTINIIRLGQC